MTAPTTPETLDAATIAELNDLLQLDHDAVQSYTLAARQLESAAYRETIFRYRADHERHIAELGEAIRQHGGMPVELPHPTGVAKLAQQAAGSLSGTDTQVLIAFRNNERQARDKYARAAERAAAWPEEIRQIVRRGAEDESRHYEWVDMTVQSLGVTDDSVLGRAARVHETVHAKTADVVESVGKKGMQGMEVARRGVMRTIEQQPLLAALAVVGTGVLAGALLGATRATSRYR